ncbi:MAG: methyltransferase domain-containing protein [Rhodospirillaceae bacterium]|nr:methyltransferase domain-containing protein [Rhodospirillaceae bacterium]
MNNTWNPDVYLRYEAYRARPALDLIAQIPLDVDGPIVDLGCGPGNVTKALKDQWPDRDVMGVDLSPDMLNKARNEFSESGIKWQKGDITIWQADSPQALVFSNAVLHWVTDHAAVVPRLADMIVPGGWLAFQIPVTEQSAYQKCIRATVTSGRWADQLADVWMYKDPMEPEDFYDLLAPACDPIDIWVTDYHHVLGGDNPVFDWIVGTGLTPYLSVLNETDQQDFIADYSKRVAAAYPKQADGKTLFLMKRIFVLARKR